MWLNNTIEITYLFVAEYAILFIISILIISFLDGRLSTRKEFVEKLLIKIENLKETLADKIEINKELQEEIKKKFRKENEEEN